MREFAEQVYKGKRWQKVRDYIWQRDNGLCQDCGELGEEVHHEIPLSPSNVDDPEIVYGDEHLVLLCRLCHKHRHKLLENKNVFEQRVIFDANGDPIPIPENIETGNPDAGSS